ncbi:hypothetical protein L1987_63402 [Smallanthus sonchifolius]|uniref:Uncharacterized protein n=1 Tax=Smallanthus sonchifolius TaxID=185202 RepID=A0ACB9CD41_9ASTR|nr:hypothetical protein L1987_63402 [Smallanthus sonchifolius]
MVTHVANHGEGLLVMALLTFPCEKCEVSDGRVDHWVEVISNNGKRFSQKENVDILSKASTEDLGSSNGNSVVTYVLYKSLLHWKVFEAERSDVFDQCLVLQYNDHIRRRLQTMVVVVEMENRRLRR